MDTSIGCNYFENEVDIPDEELPEAVVKLLTQKNLKIATAESCTGGLISKKITDIPGASAIFDCGVCSYSNDIKMKLLGVSEKSLKNFGAVSAETACQMAEGIAKFANADIGVSSTGVAGPQRSEKKHVGLVYIALYYNKQTICKKLNLRNKDIPDEKQRNYIRNRTANEVFKFILRAFGYSKTEEIS